MDIKLLQKALSCKTVPAVNREIGSSFELSKDILEIKYSLLEEACSDRNVRICHTIEEQMDSILKTISPYTAGQEELISILHEHGYVAVPLEPNLITESEEKDVSISESTNVVSESVISEAGLKMNLGLKKLVDKIAMCPDFSSLLELKEDFSEVGLEIRNTTNDRVMLCFIRENSENEPEPKLKIFEDYMLVGSEKDPNRELTVRFIECLTKFVKTSLNRNKVAPSEPKKNWMQTKVSPYGDAIGMVMEDSTSK